MVKKNKRKKAKSSSSNITKRILIGLLIVVLVGIFAAGGVALAMIKSAPPLDVDAIHNLNEDSMIFDNKDEFMDYVPTVEKRSIVSLNEMSQYLKDAAVSIEDERFYKHKGIDLKRIMGALYTNVKNKFTGSQGIHGASTITQQLLKNTLLTSDVNVTRKVQEMYMAIQLEKKLSKDEILEAYLNTIPLGGRAYGVEAAAIQYFGKQAKDLSLIESAYIVGVTQNPSRFYAFSPAAKKDPTPYINKTKTVLDKMLENGYISQEDHNTAIADIDANGIAFNPQTTDSNKLNYEWFSVPVINKVKEDLKLEYNYTDDEVEKLITYGGLKIYTTMDKELQDYTTNEVLNKSHTFLRNVPAPTNDGNIVQPQMGASVMDYRTGEVKVLVGGRGDHPPMSYNRATSTKYLRNPGSTIKPLTVYAPLLDLKMATAGTAINDSSTTGDFTAKYGHKFNNVTNSYLGYITLREAVRQSVNVAAVQAEDMLGLSNGVAYGEKFGIRFNNESKTSISALALGEFDNNPNDMDGVNPLTMAAAYGTFGNGGTYTDPILYTKVLDRNGQVILESNLNQKQVISPQASYIMYDVLKGPVSYTGTNAKFGSMPVAGKTGSSTEFKNLWFSGLTPYYSAAVWIGSDIPENLNSKYGLNSNSAALIWGKIMAKVHSGLDYREIEMPSGIVKEEICSVSGKLATSLCANDPRGSKVYTELFIDGTVPTSLCDAHISAKINKTNNKLATDKTSSELIEERVFLSDKYISTSDDAKYRVPTEEDDSVSKVEEPTTPSEDEVKDENTDENKDKEDDAEDTTTEPSKSDKDTTKDETKTDKTGQSSTTNTTDTTKKSK